MPSNEFVMFERNMLYARDQVATATALQAQLTSAFSTDDLLRSALVQGVSAFDHFVHEEVRARMLEIQNGERPTCSGFARFRVSLSSLARADVGSTEWLDSEIREQHGYLSFQHPDRVSEAIRLVSDVRLWPAVGHRLNMAADEVKRELKLIVDRRNKIAHEADTDPTPPRGRYPISARDVTDGLDFLDSVVKAIIVVI